MRFLICCKFSVFFFTAADEMNKKKLHGDSSTSEHNNSNMVISISIACDFLCFYFFVV